MILLCFAAQWFLLMTPIQNRVHYKTISVAFICNFEPPGVLCW